MYFIVIDGPVCMGDITWWQVRNDYADETPKLTYWLPEAIERSDGTYTYNIIPDRNEVTYFRCDYAERPYLFEEPSNNEMRPEPYVIPDVIPMFSAPWLESDQIGEISPSDDVSVFSDPYLAPVCIEGINWWLVEVNGIQGWINNRGDSSG